MVPMGVVCGFILGLGGGTEADGPAVGAHAKEYDHAGYEGRQAVILVCDVHQPRVDRGEEQQAHAKYCHRLPARAGERRWDGGSGVGAAPGWRQWLEWSIRWHVAPNRGGDLAS